MMKKALVAAFLCICVPAFAVVVRMAPDFSWPSAGGHNTTLRSLRGQPVVLLIAKSAREHAFRKQLGQLRHVYREFASRKVVFAAALEQEDGPVLSNIPFAIVRDGARVAAAYGVSEPFNIIVIGKDGNVDVQTWKILPAQRIHDVIQNSFAIQAEERK